jgi:hypothetical protein
MVVGGFRRRGRALFNASSRPRAKLSVNPERLAAVSLYRLADLAKTTLTADQLPQYWKLMRSIYSPRLAVLGFDPKVGRTRGSLHSQAMRQSLVPLVQSRAGTRSLREQLRICGCRLLWRHAGARSAFSRHGAEGRRAGAGHVPFMKRLQGSHAEINGLAVPF